MAGKGMWRWLCVCVCVVDAGDVVSVEAKESMSRLDMALEI